MLRMWNKIIYVIRHTYAYDIHMVWHTYANKILTSSTRRTSITSLFSSEPEKTASTRLSQVVFTHYRQRTNLKVIFFSHNLCTGVISQCQKNVTDTNIIKTQHITMNIKNCIWGHAAMPARVQPFKIGLCCDLECIWSVPGTGPKQMSTIIVVYLSIYVQPNYEAIMHQWEKNP